MTDGRSLSGPMQRRTFLQRSATVVGSIAAYSFLGATPASALKWVAHNCRTQGASMTTAIKMCAIPRSAERHGDRLPRTPLEA